VVAGYALFTGKARCGSCHPPPLYTDHDYHRLGLIASPDDGRGRVDPALAGAFKTPSLVGLARSAPYYHDGSAATLDAAIDWHLAGGRGQGADPSVIDPGLAPVTLTPAERAQLGAFVAAATADGPAPAYSATATVSPGRGRGRRRSRSAPRRCGPSSARWRWRPGCAAAPSPPAICRWPRSSARATARRWC